ncbi:MAG TPA: DUF2723 domain-containing protein [bacterium]|nr:DUF2723 domain-containing protein [bacterium]
MIISVLLFFFTFFFYLRTHCASFNINDSGETIMVCDLLTVGHSPGYPLHALWGRVFCLFPLGQPMFRVTLCSMFTGAVAVVVLYWTLKLCLKEHLFAGGRPIQDNHPSGIVVSHWLYEWPALFGSLCFAFSYQHWFQVGGCKGGIYALNTFFSLMMLFLVFKMREQGWFIRAFYLMGFVFSLGLAHHWPSSGVLVPCLFWLLVHSQNRVPVSEFLGLLVNPLAILSVVSVFAFSFLVTGGNWILGMAFTSLFVACYTAVRIFGYTHFFRFFSLCVVGITPYLYLPFRSVKHPIVNWWNPTNFDRLWGTIIRKGYQDIGEKRGIVTFVRNIKRFWFHAHDQFGTLFSYVVFALVIYGLYWFWKKQRANAIGFFLFAFAVFIAVLLFPNPLEGYQWTLDNFFTPVFMIFSILAAAGMAGLIQIAFNRFPDIRARGAIGGFCLGLAFLPMELNYHADDQSRYVSAYDYGVNMLKSVNRNAVIFCNGDIDILPLWYMQYVLGKRPEVVSFTMQLIPYDWYRDPLMERSPFLYVPVGQDVRPETVVQDMINAHSDEKSFYYTNIFTADWMRNNNPSVPEGFMWRMTNSKDLGYPFDSKRLNQYWSTYRLRYMDDPERGYWDEYTDVMKDSYGIGYDFTGYFAYMNKLPEAALWSFNNALKFRQPQTKARIYMMMGETYLSMNNGAAAIPCYEEVLKREPNNPYAISRIGKCYTLLKDYGNADQAYRLALSVNPQQKEALDGLQELSDLEKKAHK